jgi:hypothetical protein
MLIHKRAGKIKLFSVSKKHTSLVHTHIETESEKMENDIPSKCKHIPKQIPNQYPKQVGVAIFDKVDVKPKISHKR